jgi:hypothetical protein
VYSIFALWALGCIFAICFACGECAYLNCCFGHCKGRGLCLSRPPSCNHLPSHSTTTNSQPNTCTSGQHYHQQQQQQLAPAFAGTTGPHTASFSVHQQYTGTASINFPCHSTDAGWLASSSTASTTLGGVTSVTSNPAVVTLTRGGASSCGPSAQSAFDLNGVAGCGGVRGSAGAMGRNLPPQQTELSGSSQTSSSSNSCGNSWGKY